MTREFTYHTPVIDYTPSLEAMILLSQVMESYDSNLQGFEVRAIAEWFHMQFSKYPDGKE